MSSLPVLTPPQWGLSLWVLAPIVLFVWIAVLLVARMFLLTALRRVAARTPWAWDDLIAAALPAPLLISILASGLLVSERILPLEPEWDRGFDVLFAFSMALSLVLFCDRVIGGLLNLAAARSAILEGSRGLIQAVIRGVIVGIGLLIFLDSIGISITPILASLGVGSLAVALALQDTLANMFAGVYMIADKPIEPGQMVRLPTGEEGYVLRIGWRSTSIRLLANNTLIIPNAKLAGGSIINYDLPAREIAVNVPLGVHYGSDLDQVERVTLEVARDTLRAVDGGIATVEPVLHYQGFGDSSIQMSVSLRVRDFPATHAVRHEFVKRLQARYAREGIVIPYPIRSLDFPDTHVGGLKDVFGPPSGQQPERPVGFRTPPGPGPGSGPGSGRSGA